MDTIFINDLKVAVLIGIYPWESRVKQNLFIDLELAADIRVAAANEDLEKSIDYSALTQKLIAYLENQPFKLIETLAEKTAEFLLHEFQIPWLRLKIRKPHAISCAKEVGVMIERGKKSEPRP